MFNISESLQEFTSHFIPLPMTQLQTECNKVEIERFWHAGGRTTTKVEIVQNDPIFLMVIKFSGNVANFPHHPSLMPFEKDVNENKKSAYNFMAKLITFLSKCRL